MWRLVAATVVASTITFTQIAYAAERDWTGFYSGVNIGYSWGDASTDITGNGTTTVVAGIVPGFPGFFSSFGFIFQSLNVIDFYFQSIVKSKLENYLNSWSAQFLNKKITNLAKNA